MTEHLAADSPTTDIESVLGALTEGMSGRRLLLLSDFDGTLCAFAPDPEAVSLPETRRRLLSSLARQPDVTVGIVSGRRLADVRARTRLDGPVFYAGLHGMEIEGEGVHFAAERLSETRGLLQVIARSLQAHVAELPGVWVENKGPSVALHVREAAPEHWAQAETILARLAGPHLESAALRMLIGSCVFELLPNIAWNKGDAVLWIKAEVERQRRQPVWPVYLGDDETDEDAFRVIGSEGTTIVVGPHPSQAAFRLKDPDAVEQLLRRLVASRLGE